VARPIGYYVHHHGDGHRQRALAIARAAGAGVTLIGTGLSRRTGDVPSVDLPDDRIPGAGFDGSDHGERPSSLHYAPIDHEGVRRRVARMAGWIAEARPALIVVDVSVEVAMLARLASVPTVYVRLNGHRFDRPHFDAYRGAGGLLAPFHPDLDDDRTPDAIRRKTFYAPGIVDAPVIAGHVEEDVVLVVVGRGGMPADGEVWAGAAAAHPKLRWRVIGPCSAPGSIPGNLELRGWVDDAQRMIASAGVVIGGAGDGLVGSVIAHRKPFVCVPEPRPFEEQLSKARRLSALGAAVVCLELPAAGLWGELITRARGLDPEAIGRLGCSNGADTAARWLRRVADETSRIRSRSA
jgi:hypothetical protein